VAVAADAGPVAVAVADGELAAAGKEVAATGGAVTV
jgi:hypothetical protein